MKLTITVATAFIGFGALALAAPASAATMGGVACTSPPPDHCVRGLPCQGAFLANPGTAVDPKTGRKFFLDYPCDLKPNEKVVFILNLHGAGSIGQWQRHYFPAFDDKEKYRLVVATPTAATSPVRVPGTPGVRVWVAAEDDQYLQNIADFVFDAFGRKNIKAFWLAGHSQGGITSNRIVCSPYFADKVDGFLSLSGGRLGGSNMNPRFGPPKPDGSPPDPRPPGAPGLGSAPLPKCDFSFIYETGEHEITSLQETSPWAEKYGCSPRITRKDIVDVEPGYVYDDGRQGYPVWGLKPRPGTTKEYVFDKCQGGKVVADFERLDKGHTEGLEPKVTDEIVRLMVSAPGGKVAKAAG